MATFTPAKAAPPTPVAAVPGAAPVIMSKVTGVPVVKDDAEFKALSFEQKMLVWNYYITEPITCWGSANHSSRTW